MKEKISVTVEKPLVEFLDSIPGASRSAKLERVLRDMRRWAREVGLRQALATPRDSKREHLEREDDAFWSQVMQEAMWKAG